MKEKKKRQLNKGNVSRITFQGSFTDRTRHADSLLVYAVTQMRGGAYRMDSSDDTTVRRAAVVPNRLLIQFSQKSTVFALSSVGEHKFCSCVYIERIEVTSLPVNIKTSVVMVPFFFKSLLIVCAPNIINHQKH